MFRRGFGSLLVLSMAWIGCGADEGGESKMSESVRFPSVGKIIRLDPRLDQLIGVGTAIEKLAEGFDWSEGPVWISRPGDSQAGELLFSDVPRNVIFRWNEGSGVDVYLDPSGYTGSAPPSPEPGSNGLTVDAQGRLTMCEHGDRRVSRVEADGTKTTLAATFQGKRFNSPNDLCFHSSGDLYFTDPPYGLAQGESDPEREIDFQGVYRVRETGEIDLLTAEMSRPNGLAFSPDEKTLYIANSDPEKAVWMAFDVAQDGSIDRGRVFFDATSRVADHKGLPDGLKVDRQGILFATGPGGVLILTPDGEHLGTIDTGEATANVAWGGDGSELYITADKYLCRVKTRTKGAGW